MTRRIAVFGAVAVALAVLAAPAHAGGKRLPKAVSLVERIREAPAQTHYVRTASAKPAPVQSGTVRLARDYNQSHFVREAPAAR